LKREAVEVDELDLRCEVCRWFDNAAAGVVSRPPELSAELAQQHERCAERRDRRIEMLVAQALAGGGRHGELEIPRVQPGPGSYSGAEQDSRAVAISQTTKTFPHGAASVTHDTGVPAAKLVSVVPATTTNPLGRLTLQASISSGVITVKVDGRQVAPFDVVLTWDA
jgi:hypothetical protein